jgi:hypothetical protein
VLEVLVPRIKRWFPVSHDFLDDPQTIELIDRFGPRIIFMWMRMLSWSDRNEGCLGTRAQVLGGFARTYDPPHPHLAATRAAPALDLMITWGWVVEHQGLMYIANYAKYHPSRGDNKSRAGDNQYPLLPNPPNLPILSEPLKIKNEAEPTPQNGEEPAPPGHLLKEDTKPSKLNPKIKEWADQVYAIDPAKFKGLVRWIKAAERTYQPDVIAKTLEHFLPYASQTSDWWPYLDKILDKTEAKANGSETQQQSEHHKQADRDFAKLLFGRK